MANKILNLDLSKDPDLPVFIYGRVGDEMMQTATVNITNHDQQKSLEGYVITFEGTINNKIKVFDSDNVKPIDLAKGTFEYTFPSAAFSLAGTYDRAYFSIAKGELRDTTGDFKIVVSSNADITAEEAETIITEYNRLVEKLNQAFKDSVEQMESDYSELESTIEGIKGDISELNIKINNYQESVQNTAEEAVNTISTSVNNAIGEITQAVDKALQKLEAGDFYTKAAADTKFQGYQSTPIMAQDWNTITQPGIYYVNNATGANKPDLLATTMYGFLEVINNKFSSNALVHRFISFNNEICTRRYSGNPINWGAWELTITKKNLLDLTHPIGSIYQSVNDTDPAALFGGEWERIVGKTLIGVDEGDSDFNTSGKTGGSKKQSYDINENNAQAQLQLSGTTVAGNVKTTSSYTATIRNTSAMTFSTQDMASTGGIGVRGKTEEGNNLQPYFTAYMWVRVG